MTKDLRCISYPSLSLYTNHSTRSNSLRLECRDRPGQTQGIEDAPMSKLILANHQNGKGQTEQPYPDFPLFHTRQACGARRFVARIEPLVTLLLDPDISKNEPISVW